MISDADEDILTFDVRRRRFLQIVTGVLAIPVVSGNVRAQDYPTRPITIVVPGAPASAIDTLARFIVERTRASLGQPIIVENIVGAGGSIGAGRVAHAAPDGYTLVIGTWGTHVVNGAVYALSYDLLKRLRASCPIDRQFAANRRGENPTNEQFARFDSLAKS